MVWKTERWLADIFPGESNIYSEYRSLSPRELSVVCAAVLDAALAEILSLRLDGPPKEIEEFLGLAGDGRAPAASFGARIQLGLLVGVLTRDDAEILRRIKELRNLFAHRVRINFLSPAALKITKRLLELWVNRTKALTDAGLLDSSLDRHTEIGRLLSTVSDAGEGLLLAIFTTYQAYFHRMHHKFRRSAKQFTRSYLRIHPSLPTHNLPPNRLHSLVAKVAPARGGLRAASSPRPAHAGQPLSTLWRGAPRRSPGELLLPKTWGGRREVSCFWRFTLSKSWRGSVTPQA
jgi:hypothetical protein